MASARLTDVAEMEAERESFQTAKAAAEDRVTAMVGVEMTRHARGAAEATVDARPAVGGHPTYWETMWQLLARSAYCRDREYALTLILGIEAHGLLDGLDSRSSLHHLLQYNLRLTTFLRGQVGWISRAAISPGGAVRLRRAAQTAPSCCGT